MGNHQGRVEGHFVQVAQEMISPAGRTWRARFCERHRRSFVELLWPRVPGSEPFWSGNCADCSADAELERRAEAMIDEGELERRVSAAMLNSEPEIKAQVEREIAEETERVRPEFEDSIRIEFAERHHEEIRAELRAGIVEALKKEKG